MSAVTVSRSGRTRGRQSGRTGLASAHLISQHGDAAARSGRAGFQRTESRKQRSRVIDLGAERRRREVARALQSADLEQSISRHPAGKRLPQYAPEVPVRRPSRRAVSAPAPQRADAPQPRVAPQAVIVTPALMLRALAWITAAIFVVGSALGLGLTMRPGEYSGVTWEHTVASGESLWGLAASVSSARPLEDVVEDIRSLNSLQDVTLHPGQVLTLPAD